MNKPQFNPEQIKAASIKGADMLVQYEINKRGPGRKLTRKTKLYKFKGQDSCCALCGNGIPQDGQLCYDKQTDRIVCRRCMMGLVHVRSMLKDGITFDMLTTFDRPA